MTQVARGWRALALVTGLAASGSAWPAEGRADCLAIAAHPGGELLVELAAGAFELGYVHSVTRTPVLERYRIEGKTIVQTELRFVEHGPGMPTQADAGQGFARGDDGYVVTLQRRFSTIVMRVDAAWSPRLSSEAGTLDLARWGNRALLLSACAAS